MKKQMITFLVMLTLGCTACININYTTPNTTQEESDNQDKTSGEKKEDESNKDVEEKDISGEKEIIKVYYLNFDTEEQKCETIEVEKKDPELIWNKLKEKGILQEQCEINDFKMDAEKKTIDIDVNTEFGNYIRSMGTAGETEILDCLVKSYLESFECEKIKITENGDVFETGHTVLDDYISKN